LPRASRPERCERADEATLELRLVADEGRGIEVWERRMERGGEREKSMGGAVAAATAGEEAEGLAAP
jgi:hypothetical protein